MVSIDLSSILDSSSSSNHGFDSHSHSQSGSTVVEDGGEFDGLRMFDSGDEDGDGEGVIVDIGILV